MSDRLARFRGFMASLNATDPASAVEKGLYVPTPGTVAADRLVARLQLQPAATLAVVGGIGSGKTTQLLVARDKLEDGGDVHAIYVDVADQADLGRLAPGVLAIIAGQAMGKRLDAPSPECQRALGNLDNMANGYWLPEPDLDDFDEGRLMRIEGRIARPPHKPSDDLKGVLKHVAAVRKALRRSKPHAILLLDSLDRLADREVFATVVEQDVRALTALGIGIVMAAPLRSLYGVWRTTLLHFEDFEPLWPIDVEDENGLTFLDRVLQARVPEDGFEATARKALAKLSGGVLRDLLQLARLAAEEAYLSGAQRIEEAHVRTAADSFGRKHILGVTPAELATLQRLQWRQEFVPVSDDDLALLTTRRVLEYQRGRVEYALHPTLVPLLEQLAHTA